MPCVLCIAVVLMGSRPGCVVPGQGARVSACPHASGVVVRYAWRGTANSEVTRVTNVRTNVRSTRAVKY